MTVEITTIPDEAIKDSRAKINTNFGNVKTSVDLNDTHRGSDGKDHSDVVLNNTHRTSDGKDHSDVVLNNAHRVATTNPHTVTIDQVTPTTTKGDLLVENGTVVTRLPVGTNTQVLASNSSTATGLQWQDAGLPGAHKDSHEDGGADEVTLTGLAVGTGTVVGTDATQTLTNKTLTSPVLSDTTPTADGAIGFDRTNENLVVGDGTNSQVVGLGEWKTWTPTWTNLTVGNGTQISKYTQIGKTVHYYIKFTLGSTSAVTGASNFTLPITPIFTTLAVDPIFGHCNLRDVTAGATGSFVGFARSAGSDAVFIGVNSVGTGNYIINGALNTTVPFTWAADDVITIFGTYEAA